ncbi:hypothetical protein ACSFE6_16360 [Pseudomonas baetica]|uniref:hypothetical protein n=1 Tax=Pseudomonas baetica TaxID=674054 RepID=UPI003EEBE654
MKYAGQADLVYNQTSMDKYWEFVQKYLETEKLSAPEMFAILSSGLLYTATGSRLAKLFVDAAIRSIRPEGDSAAEKLRVLLEAICCFPPCQWGGELLERLKIPQSGAKEGIAEWLPDTQWQSLKKIIRDCRPSIGPWLEGELDNDSENVDRLDCTLSKLEEFFECCPTSKDAKNLLGEFLDDLTYTKGRENFPDQQKRALYELWRSIEPPSTPSSAVFLDSVQLFVNSINSALDGARALSVKDVGHGIYSNTKSAMHFIANKIASLVFRSSLVPSEVVPMKTGNEGGFTLLSTLREIELKGDFYDYVDPCGLRDINALAAKIMCVMNVLKSFTDMNPMDRVGPPRSPPNLRQITYVPKPQAQHVKPAPEKAVFSAVSMSEQVGQFAQQADQLLNQAIHVFTGWNPVAAVELEDLSDQLKAFKEKLLNANVKTPFAGVPSSSYGAVGNPYGNTVEQVEPGILEKFGIQLAEWLKSTANYLAVAGVTTSSTAITFIRQRPRATATVGFAAIHAAISDFHNRWFGDAATPVDPHLAPEADPALREFIIDNVVLTLNEMPEVDQYVRERLNASSYDDPHLDPDLVADVKSFLQQPVPSNPEETYAELVDESVLNSKDRYSRLMFSHFDVDENGNTHVVQEDIPAHSQRVESSEPADESAQWVLEAVNQEQLTQVADGTLQTSIVERLESEHDFLVTAPKDSSMSKPLELYEQALNDPKVNAWFESKGLDVSTLIIHKDSVSGTVTRDGVSTHQKFSVWDTSGWWQASSELLPILALLDPKDVGLRYIDEDWSTIPVAVALNFYGVTPPTSEANAKSLASQLKASDWPAFTASKKARLKKAIEGVERGTHEAGVRAQLINALELSVAGKAENATVSLSGKMAGFVSLSLTEKSEKIRKHLNDFVALPAMVNICKARGIDCSKHPVRLTEKRIQVYFKDKWINLAGAINNNPVLKGKLDELIAHAENTGGALYTNSSNDLLQMIRFMGFDVPENAGGIRNVIRWLKTSLPPSPPLGNYAAGLLSGTATGFMLSETDRALLIEWSNKPLSGVPSILHALGFNTLPNDAAENIRNKAELILNLMLNSGRLNVDSWGQRFVEKLGWYGAANGETSSMYQYQQLLLAAIKLNVDPDAPGKFGTIAGYDIYQAKNMGRDFGAIRTDIEEHLIKNKGVSAGAAPLVANLFLADVAPEFLVTVNSTILMGSASWLTLRLGTVIAETTNPGCSRGLTDQQLMELAVLEPVTAEHRLLVQNMGVDIMVAWGVMNGVIQSRATSVYSKDDYENAARSFDLQQKEQTEAFRALAKPLISREDLALAELRKIFPGIADDQIRGVKLWNKKLSVGINHQMMSGSGQSLLEVYMSGKLNGDWKVLVNDEEFQEKRKQLPDINEILRSSVDAYFDEYQEGFINSIRLLFSGLPLEDRQCLELGKVELFTLREETDVAIDSETPEIRASFRGRFGTLIRCEHQGKVIYFEVFPARMKIIKRTDLPADLKLGGIPKVDGSPLDPGYPHLLAVKERGSELSFDFQAYSTGTEPRANVKSSKLIVEKLGDGFSAKPLRVGDNKATAVPNSYFSSRILQIANRLISDNFLQGRKEFILKSAKGETSLERWDAYWRSVGEYLVQLIPFVGCVQDIASGERDRVLFGVFSCSMDALMIVLGLSGGAAKIAGLAKSVVPVKYKAFQIMKIATTSLVSASNPFGGARDLMKGGVSTLKNVGNFVSSGVCHATVSGAMLLLTGVDKLRIFLGGRIFEAVSSPPTPGWQEAQLASCTGLLGGIKTSAVQVNGKWYGIDNDGRPFGPPLSGFTPLNPPDQA